MYNSVQCILQLSTKIYLQRVPYIKGSPFRLSLKMEDETVFRAISVSRAVVESSQYVYEERVQFLKP